MFLGMFRFRLDEKVLRRIIGLIFVVVMNVLSRKQEPAEFVFSKHPVEGIQALGISFRMWRICAAIPITAAITNRQNLKHMAIVILSSYDCQ
jgi:hypothetical protein